VSLRASVVIATYNRGPSVERLLRQLVAQTVRAIEVIVVDDGSREDPTPRLRMLDVPFPLVVERQENAGAAAARHRGALLAHAPVVIFLDDDMQVDASFIAAHLDIHDRDERAVVLGRIKPDIEMRQELVERFHADVLDRFATDVVAGRRSVRGPNVYTGNLSVKRDAYMRTGGFDATLGHSEDAELGVRLEKDGAAFHLSDAAASIHSSDRGSVAGWRARAKKYGIFDTRISKKHPDALNANPWRYLHELPPLARPWLVLSVLSPAVGERVAAVTLRCAAALDRRGRERAALRAVTLAFGVDYARGLREEAGTTMQALTDWLGYLDARGDHETLARATRATRTLRRAVIADHDTLRRHTAKYGGSLGSLPRDAVVRLGFQLMVAVRVMHFFRDLGADHAAMVTSRLIRHLYGADIHWEAVIAPGVQVVHGMGLAISPKARIGPDVILFQNVTLGESNGGAPSIDARVHIGPGATLLGPITVGEETKVMAGCVVRENIPPRSIVNAAVPSVQPRVSAPPQPRSAHNGSAVS
jgi:serine acetyltransferase/GT2 family glycosyltransferase